MMDNEGREEALRENFNYRIKLAKKPYRELKNLDVQTYYYASSKRRHGIRQHTEYRANGSTVQQSLAGIDNQLLEKLKRNINE